MGSSVCTPRRQTQTDTESYYDYTSSEDQLSDLQFPDAETAKSAKGFSIGQPGDTFPGRCVRVYDGDTFYVAFKFRGLTNVFTVRLYGIDCPELRPRKTLFANEESRLAHKARGIAARDRVIELIKDRNVLVEVRGKEKFGRLLASIYINSGNGEFNTDLATLLVREGHGVGYFGGTKAAD